MAYGQWLNKTCLKQWEYLLNNNMPQTDEETVSTLQIQQDNK